MLTEKIQEIFQPTYLYIKQHSVTGLKYFGKTVSKNPIRYLGSGTYWKHHIKKHGKEHIVTLWTQLFLTQKDLTDYALSFSKEHNIVESTEWANLTVEDGIGGYMTESIKRQISKTTIGKKKPIRTQKHRNNMSLAKAGQNKGTPWSDARREAHINSKAIRQGRKLIIDGIEYPSEMSALRALGCCPQKARKLSS